MSNSKNYTLFSFANQKRCRLFYVVSVLVTMFCVGLSSDFVFAQTDLNGSDATITASGSWSQSYTNSNTETQSTVYINSLANGSGYTYSGTLTNNIVVDITHQGYTNNSNRINFSGKNNNFTGGLVVHKGTVRSTVSSGDTSIYKNGVTLNNAIIMSNSTTTCSSQLTLDGFGGLRSSGNFTWSGKITGTGDLGIVAESGSTVIISGTSNDYTGVTTIGTVPTYSGNKSAKLKLGNNNVLPSTTVVEIAKSQNPNYSFTSCTTASFDLNGKTQTIAGLYGAGKASVINSAKSASTLTINLQDGNSYEYSGTISGYSSDYLTTINIQGSGTQTLAGNLSAVTINANSGTTILGKAGQSITTSNATHLKGSIQLDGNLNSATGEKNLYVSGTWTGDGTITVTSAQIRFCGDFEYANGIHLNNSLLVNDNNGPHITAPIYIEGSSTIQAGWSKTVYLYGPIQGTGNLIIGKDSGTIKIEGAASSDSYFSSPITLKGLILVGKYEGTGVSATPYIGTGKITMEGGTLQNNSNYLTVDNDLYFASTSYLKSGWSKDTTYTGYLTGSGTLNVLSDSGTVIFKTKVDNTQADAFSGIVKFNYDSSSSYAKGKLAVDNAFGTNAGELRLYGNLDMAGYSQTFKGMLSDGTKGVLYNSSSKTSTITLDLPSGKEYTYYGVVKNDIDMIIQGDGTMTFNNHSSSWTGDITVKSGATLKSTASNQKASTFGSGKITVEAGAILDVSTNSNSFGYDTSPNELYIYGTLKPARNTHLKNITLNNGTVEANTDSYGLDFSTRASASITAYGDSIIKANFNTNSQLKIDVSNIKDDEGTVITESVLTCSKAIRGSGTITKTGDGELLLTVRSNTNTSAGVAERTGDFVIEEGTVTVTADNDSTSAFGTGGSVTIKSGAILDVSLTTNAFGYATSAPNDLYIYGTLKPQGNTHVKNIELNNGLITEETGDGNGLDFKNRTATVTSSGESSIQSKLSISSANVTFNITDGVLTLSKPITGSGTVTKTGEGTLLLTGTGTEMLGTNVVNLNGGYMEFAPVAETEMHVSNKISGTGTIIKSDEGTLYINSYKNSETDDHSISVSSLLLEGGTAMIKGFVTGNIQVGNKNTDGEVIGFAKLSPGNSVGVLDVDGNVAVLPDSTLWFEQDATGMDQLILETGNTLTIDKDAILELTMGEVIPGAKYTIIENGSEFTGDYASDNFWNSLLTPSSNYYWNLSVDGNKVFAQIDPNAVPEPSTWALLILGTAGLIWYRRRK